MSPKRNLTLLASRVLFLVVALAINDAFGIVTSDEFGSHVIDPGELAFDMDFDGVGIVGFLSDAGDPIRFCSGALITDRHFLSAAHCFDLDEDGHGDLDGLELPPGKHAVMFEVEEDHHWVAIDYDLNTVRWPAQWPDSRGDIAVVALSTDAPEGIPRYQLNGAQNEIGKPFVMSGYGAAGHGAAGMGPELGTTFQKRAGLNRYDAIRDDYPGVDFLAYDFDSGLPENNAFELFGVDSDLGFGVDETVHAIGDSGGPSFINGAIAGVIAFGGRLAGADVNEELDSSWGEGAFDTRVSTFRDFILDATDGLATFQYDSSGDIDGDGLLMANDIDILTMGILDGNEGLPFDINADGFVDDMDRTVWVIELKGTYFGDANLDGEFNSGDFVDLFKAGEYEDDIEDNSGWATGDWNGDRDFDSSDFVSAFTDGGYEQGPRPTAAVPEPSSLVLLMLGLIGIAIQRRRP